MAAVIFFEIELMLVLFDRFTFSSSKLIDRLLFYFYILSEGYLIWINAFIY